MNKLLSLTVCTLLATASSLAHAAPRDGDRGYRDRDHRHGYYDDDDRGRHHGRHRGRHHDDDRYDRHGWHDRRHEERRYYSDHRYRAPRHYRRPPGYYARRWAPGHYLPRAYYAPVYVVDYRPYRLPPPRRGHHWVRVDNDVFLVALASGLVIDAVYGLFY